MKHDFQVAEDGRLIIHDEEEEMENDGAKGTAWAGRDYARPALALPVFFYPVCASTGVWGNVSGHL